MTQYICLFLASLGLTLAFTPPIRWLALQIGLVDHPDGRRKIHAKPIPVVGGVAVFVSALLAIGLGIALRSPWANNFAENARAYFGLLGAAFIIAVVGVVDDSRGLRGRHKLVGQIAAVGVLIASGLLIDRVTLLGVTFELGWLGYVLTGFWMLGAINSLNLIDGIDGLLGSVGAIISLAIGGMAVLNQQWAAACVAVALAGALAGFLWFNFPPASLFLGDCGSMLIGLVVGALAIMCSFKGAAIALATPVSLLVIPIVDSSAAIIRRKLTGRSIYTTDRGHLHHVLMRRGLSNRLVVFLVAGLCVIAGLGAWLSLWFASELVAALAAAAVAGILVFFRLFGYAEFMLIKERLSAVLFAVRHGSEHGRVHQLEVRLQGSADWNELWRDLTACADRLNLKTLCLDLNAPSIHEGYHARWDRRLTGGAEASTFWKAELPLVAGGHVVGRLEVVGLRDGESVWESIAALAQIGENVERTIQHLSVRHARPQPSAEPALSEPLRLAPSA